MGNEEMVELMEYWRSHLSPGLLMELSHNKRGYFLIASAVFMVNSVKNDGKAEVGGQVVDDISCLINILWTNGRLLGGSGLTTVRISDIVNNTDFSMNILADFRACRDMRDIPRKISSLIISTLAVKASTALGNNHMSVDSAGDPAVAVQRISTLFPTGFMRDSSPNKKKKVAASFKRRTRQLRARKGIRKESAVVEVAATQSALGIMFYPFSASAGGAEPPEAPLIMVRGTNPRYISGRSDYWTNQYVIDHIPRDQFILAENEGHDGQYDAFAIIKVAKRDAFHCPEDRTPFDGDYVAESFEWHTENITHGYYLYILNNIDIRELAGLEDWLYPVF